MLTIMFILIISCVHLGFGVLVTVLICRIWGEGSMCLKPTHLFHTLRTKERCTHQYMNGDTEMALQDGSKERPDIEVLNPILGIREVQDGTLAKGNSEQTVSVETSRSWMPAKEGFQISDCNVSKSTEIRHGDWFH